jgi:hypothetical protein
MTEGAQRFFDPGCYISLNLNPGMDLPIGESAEYFALGGSGNLSLEYGLSTAPLVFVSAATAATRRMTRGSGGRPQEP